MKKTLLIFISICFFIFNVKLVTAADTCTFTSSNNYGKLTGQKMNDMIYGWVMKDPADSGHYSEDAYQYGYLELTCGSENYAAYCRNAGISADITSPGDQLEIIETLFTSSDPERVAYDTGLAYILNYNYDSQKSNMGLYSSIQLAARMYEILWPNINTNGATDLDDDGDLYTDYSPLYKAHVKTVEKYWSQISDLVGKLDKNYKMITKKGLDNFDYSSRTLKRWYPSSKNCVGRCDYSWEFKALSWDTSVEEDALKVLKTALNKATTAKGVATISSSKASASANVTKNGAGKELYTKTLTYTITAKNFNSKNAYIKAVLDIQKSNGVTANLYVNNETTPITSDTNLLDYVNDKGKIYLKLKLSAYTEDYICENLKYNITLNYKDDSISSTINTVRKKGVETAQRLYVMRKITEVSKDITGGYKTEEFCQDSCENVRNSCLINSSALACQIYKDKYNETCTVCSTKVDMPVCETASDTSFDIKEGYSYDTETNGDLKCNTVSANTNVLSCVLNGEDEAGNSYKSNLVENNDYCSVFCKEDYHITLPGQRETLSGRYFTLSAAISGAKTCYTTQIDYTKFETDIKTASTEVQTAYNTWNASKTNANLNILKSKASAFNSILDNYNSCSNWNMTYNYDADIKFVYDEEYMKLLEDKNTFEANKTMTNVVKSYCSGDVTDDYTCKTASTSAPGTKAISLFTCSYNKANNTVKTDECSVQTINVSDAKYVSQTSSVSANYITPTNFYAIYPYRTIVVSDSDVENASKLENQLPVGLGKTKGVYTYALKVENLGEYYDTGKLGRIWGSDKSVVDIIVSDTDRECTEANTSLTDSYTKNNASLKDGVYICGYKVNCPDCPVECDPSCSLTCPDCPVECDQCIYNNDLNTNYRPITNEDVNPSDRELGENWQYDDSIETGLELKAYVTTEEIEDAGNTIYDTDAYEGNVIKVTMDSKMISKIRDYNRANEDKGGYLSNSLKCYDHKNADGDTYENVYCYSIFIDELLYDNDTKDNIKIYYQGSENKVERIIGGNSEETDNLRKTRANQQANSGKLSYWTTWSDVAYNNAWNITTENYLAITQKKYGADVNIGPSWK